MQSMLKRSLLGCLSGCALWLPNVAFAQPSSWNWTFGQQAGISWNQAAATPFFPQVSHANGSNVSTLKAGALDVIFSSTGLFSSNYTALNGANPPYAHAMDYRSKVLAPFGDSAGVYDGWWMAPSTNNYQLMHQRMAGGPSDQVFGVPQMVYDSLGPTFELVRLKGFTSYWLVGHIHNSNRFVSLRVNNGQVVDTIFSRLGQSGRYRTIRTNRAGNTLFLGKENVDSLTISFENFTLASFDTATGILDTILLGSVGIQPFSASFSPSGERLYVTHEGQKDAAGRVLAYDLTQANPLANPYTVIQHTSGQPGSLGMLQLAADQHLYLAMPGVNRVGRIFCPDALEDAIQFNPSALNFSAVDGYVVTSMLPFIPEPDRALPVVLPDTVFMCNEPPLIPIQSQWEALAWTKEDGSPVTQPDEPGKFFLTVSRGCQTYRDSVQVIRIENTVPPILPNVFTPNADGVNDVYLPILATPLDGFRMSIFNRWGMKIFVSESYLDGWDGAGLVGGMTEGVYFVVVQYLNCQGEPKSDVGQFHLFR